MKKFLLLFGLAFSALGLVSQTPKIKLDAFGSAAFSNPVDIAHCGDSRLFVVERKGVIEAIDSVGTSLGVFLDITSKVKSTQNEQGLLGMAFHPDFAQNGFFYVYFTDKTGTGNTQVTRFTVSSTDPNKADPASETPILNQVQPYWNHNGGCLKFGLDGFLYIGLGDGGSGNDPENNGQKKATFLGKILRIDVDGGSPYAVPADNPFVNDAAYFPEIWTMGMRNPWRFSFDRQTGDLWIGDVGQNSREEVDRIPAGQGGWNFGWRCREGFNAGVTSGCPAGGATAFNEPIYDYPNPSKGCSVIGGFVYRGAAFPALFGKYLFCDYCSGRFWLTEPDAAAANGFKTTEIANLTDYAYAAFGENRDGELFVVGHDNNKLYKLSEVCGAFAIEATVTASSCPFSAVGSATVATAGSLATTFTYAWSNGKTTKDLTDLPAGQYIVTVTDGNQCKLTDTVTVAELVATPLIAVNSGGVLSVAPTFLNIKWYKEAAAGVLFEPVAGATSATFVPTETGVYLAQANDAATGCAMQSEQVEVTALSGVEKLPASVRSMAVLPNPFGQNFELQMAFSAPKAVRVTVSDAANRLIFNQLCEKAASLSLPIDLGAAPAGQYVLTAEIEGGERAVRLIFKQ